jgi:hypothetical protein
MLLISIKQYVLEKNRSVVKVFDTIFQRDRVCRNFTFPLYFPFLPSLSTTSFILVHSTLLPLQLNNETIQCEDDGVLYQGQQHMWPDEAPN